MKKLILSTIILLSLLITQGQTIYIKPHINSDSIKTFDNNSGTYLIKKHEAYFSKILGLSGGTFDGKTRGKKKKFDCDFDTFELIRDGYAKDKNNIYCDGKKILGIDYDSFKTVAISDSLKRLQIGLLSYKTYNYGKDKNYVYYENKVLPDADVESFKIWSNSFTSDKNQAYYFGRKIEGSDGASFQLVHGHFAKDKNHVYCDNTIFSNEPNSFEVLDKHGYFVKDKDNVLYLRFAKNLPCKEIDTIKDVDIEKFSCLGGYYFSDDKNVFYLKEKLPNVDVQTFKLIEYDASKDTNFVYLIEKRKIEDKGINLRLTRYITYAQDAHTVYYKNKIIQHADPESFVPLTYEWSKDKNSIYFQEKERILI